MLGIEWPGPTGRFLRQARSERWPWSICCNGANTLAGTGQVGSGRREPRPRRAVVSFSDLPVALFLSSADVRTFPVVLFQAMDY